MAKREVNVRGIELVVDRVVNEDRPAYIVCHSEGEALMILNHLVSFGSGAKITMLKDDRGLPSGVLFVEKPTQDVTT